MIYANFHVFLDTFWEYGKLLCKWISQAGKIVESHFSVPNSLWCCAKKTQLEFVRDTTVSGYEEADLLFINK